MASGPDLNKNNSEDETDETSEEEKALATPFQRQNLILKIGKRELSVNKEQLTANSTVFNRMLQSDFVEATTNEINLPGKKFGPFVRFLRHILPGFDEQLTKDTVHYLLQLADEYQTDKFIGEIDSFLANTITEKGDSMNSDDMITNIIEAERYKLPKYLNACIRITSRKMYGNLKRNPRFLEITLNTRYRILTSKVKGIEAICDQKRGLFSALQTAPILNYMRIDTPTTKQ